MDNQRNETYINHPTFGLLYRICLVQDDRELFTTLYAQRLFFLVTISTNKLNFEPITRSDARMLVEQKLRKLRSLDSGVEYQQLQEIYQSTFQ
ncbi:MAG TPA: transcriptional coactivator PipX [Xenococcaceae cyanobacterium]